MEGFCPNNQMNCDVCGRHVNSNARATDAGGKICEACEDKYSDDIENIEELKE